MVALLTWLAVALATLGAISVSVLALRRIGVARAERRTEEAERRLTPHALALLAGDTDELPELGPRDVLVLAGLLARYAQRLRGSERREIAAFFESQGRLEPVIEQLGNRQAWRRATAAFVLGDMSSTVAVEPLLQALYDRDAGVRAAAARSLGRLLASEAVAPLVYAFAERRLPRTVAGQALLAIGVPALPPLHDLLQAEDPAAREFAVELVGLLGDAGDADVVLERLTDTSAEVRAKAAHALGRLGAATGTAALARTLDDRVPFVRAAAARALGEVGDAQAAERLLELAAADQFDPARAAAAAAARLDPAAVHRAADADATSGHIEEAVDLLALRAR